MKVWEKVKNFFVASKNKKNPPNNIGKFISEEINEIEVLKPAGMESEKVEGFEIERTPFPPTLESESGNQDWADPKEKQESKYMNNRTIFKEVLISEVVEVEDVNATLINSVEEKVGIIGQRKPSTPLPNHNEKLEFEKYKEHYQYYLIHGPEYEQIRSIQNIKKAVREKETSYTEWFQILLDGYISSNKKVQKYILDTLNFFPLNKEELHRINEYNLSQKFVEDLKIADFKLDKPRIAGSGTVEIKFKKPVDLDLTKELKENSVEDPKLISIDDSIKKEESKKLHQNSISKLTLLKEEAIQWKINEKKRIEEECKKRDITSVYHFTNARNVKKILRHGILSLDELKRREIAYEANDSDRRDKMKNSTCWSVSFPNNKYFYIVQKRNPKMKWCVIEVEASVLSNLECYFYETNAASNAARLTPSQNRKGYEAFMKMFKRKSAADELLLSKYPTDVQAEVLITETIEPDKIKAIHTQDKIVFDYYYKYRPHLVKDTPSLFNSRQ